MDSDGPGGAIPTSPETHAELSVRAWPALARAHVTVQGDLDGDAGAALVAAVVEALQPNMVIALDLADVTGLDDAGLRAIETCRERAVQTGADLEIQDPSPAARAALAAWSRADAAATQCR